MRVDALLADRFQSRAARKKTVPYAGDHRAPAFTPRSRRTIPGCIRPPNFGILAAG